MRKFNSGAIRDTDTGKLNYFGFREPLLEQSFAKYMHGHRKMADGTMREANNWWKGWDKEVSLQSLVRHVEDLQALHAGYIIAEIRGKNGVEKQYLSLDNIDSWKDKLDDKKAEVHLLSTEDTLNAIRFNATAYQLQLLKEQ